MGIRLKNLIDEVMSYIDREPDEKTTVGEHYGHLKAGEMPFDYYLWYVDDLTEINIKFHSDYLGVHFEYDGGDLDDYQKYKYGDIDKYKLINHKINNLYMILEEYTKEDKEKFVTKDVIKRPCCHNCYDIWIPPGKSAFGRPCILCKVCGNKRCPKATDHNLECTNSNKTGQKGSRYE